MTSLIEQDVASIPQGRISSLKQLVPSLAAECDAVDPRDSVVKYSGIAMDVI